VSKKKDPMALFEVLSKQDNPESATKVPAWMKRKAAEQAQSDAPDVPQDAEAEAIDEETDDNYVVEPPPAPAAEELQKLAESQTDEIDDATDGYSEEIDENLREDDDELDEADETDDDLDDESLDNESLDNESLDDEDDTTEYDADELPDEDIEEYPAETQATAGHTPQVQAAPPPPLPDDVPTPARPAEPWLDISDQRVRLSLPILTAAITAGCIMVALVAAFTIGWLAAPGPGPAAEADSISDAQSDSARAQAPPPLNNQDRPAMVATTTGQRSPDRQYLIIETLRGASQDDLNEADRIVAFTAEHGLPADIQLTGRNTNPRYVVWSLQGFLDRESPEAEAFVEKVQRVGETYFERYGTYRFRQERDGRAQPFWVSGKQEKS
jgi:hypothetical protein